VSKAAKSAKLQRIEMKIRTQKDIFKLSTYTKHKLTETAT